MFTSSPSCHTASPWGCGEGLSHSSTLHQARTHCTSPTPRTRSSHLLPAAPGEAILHIPARWGNHLRTPGKVQPYVSGSSERRKLHKSELETTSGEHPSTDGSSHARARGTSHSKYKIQVLLPAFPLLRKAFANQKPRDRFVFARVLSL